MKLITTANPELPKRPQLTVSLTFVILGADAVALPSPALILQVGRWADTQSDPVKARAYALGFLVTVANEKEKL